MRILLPPSEGKLGGGHGPSLTEAGYGDGPVARHRSRVAARVVRTARGRRPTAVAAFVLPPGVADAALSANANVVDSATMPALERYCGVVYEALAVGTFDAATRGRAVSSVLIFSGLFGVLGAQEWIPDYRLPAAAVLPTLGPVGRSWRATLARSMPGLLGDGLVLDLRSSDYASMWRPTGEVVDRVLRVRILSRRPGGDLGVISYRSKHAKGRLARALLERPDGVRDAAGVARCWSVTEGGDAHLAEDRAGPRLDLVEAGA